MIEEPKHFENFVVTDNGNGFNTENYISFLEAYSQLKLKKGCKGIGRFLWLKAFNKVVIKSTYFEDDQWHLRTFDFSKNGVNPEQNDSIFESDNALQQTIVSLNGFKNPYRDSVAYSLESLKYNKTMEMPEYDSSDMYKKKYLDGAIKDPEVELLIIPTIDGVRFAGDFDYVVMAQSPNYTPASADFIMDIFREYIEEI